jgi:hypothetical protein
VTLTAATDLGPEPSARTRYPHKRNCTGPCSTDACGFPLCWEVEAVQSEVRRRRRKVAWRGAV